MKKTQAVIILIVLFVLGLLIGFSIPVNKSGNSQSAGLTSSASQGGAASQAGGGGGGAPSSSSGTVRLPNQSDVLPESAPSQDDINDNTITLRSTGNKSKLASAPSIGEENIFDETEVAQTSSATISKQTTNRKTDVGAAKAAYGSSITIESVSKPARKTSEPSKFYSFKVVAKSSTGSALQYILCDPRTESEEYTSKTGSFSNVAPTDDGSYILKVRDTARGEEVTQSVTGFNKVSKMSKTQLQSILNNPSAGESNKNLYFSFDTDNLRISCSGLNSDEVAPKSLSAIWSGVQLLDWNVTVIAGPSYDRYNRIESFSITVR